MLAMAHDIAVLPGDGIGPEIYEATEPLLADVADAYDVAYSTTWYDWNSEWYLERGEMMPEDGPDQLASHDAILLGAMGHPDVPDTVSSGEGHLRIRNEFDHYINLRPVTLFDGVESPLRGYDGGDIDIEWYRENSEGGYLNIGGTLTRGKHSEMAVQSTVFTERGVERIARAAFEAATERDGHLTNVTKSNAQEFAPVFWDDVVEEVSGEFPEVELRHMYVDAATLHLVQQPESFDVVVAPNLFSDILTDLTAAVTGGLGVAPSANLNPENDKPGMFEPVHGSAPDIAGDGVANPLASVLSTSLMLEDLGEVAAADALWQAVGGLLADSNAPRTPDLGGEATTGDVVADLRDRI
jgi:tartrate dehydrogenase/decarboxylase/D-malate dehydrogenase